MIQPISGNLSPYAQEGQPALEYIFNKINAEGGIKSMGGAQIQLVVADDASQPARTASEARRLITQEDVSLIVGTLLSGQMLGISPVVDEYKVPTLAMWAGGRAPITCSRSASPMTAATPSRWRISPRR